MIATSHEPSHLSEKERKKIHSRLLSPAGTNQRPLKSSQPIACSCLHFRLLLLSATNIYAYCFYGFNFICSSSVLLDETNTNVNECFSRAFSWTASPEEIMETRRHMEQIGSCRMHEQGAKACAACESVRYKLPVL